MEAKGTFGLQVEVIDESEDNDEKYGVTAMHPQIVGECIAGWIGVDEFGFREDWDLIQISNQCRIQGLSTTQRWHEDILAQVQNWGIQVETLNVVGYRDPQPGEIAFCDGARSCLTCGVISSEHTATYERASIWPDMPDKGPDLVDTCKRLTIWPYGDRAESGDSGSALFCRARVGNGVEFVGMLVSTYTDIDNDLLPELEVRCGLFVPATVIFRQMQKITGLSWNPV
ncbi:hypothetical protein EV426DRAFT_573997 [Tirmania nivea]|nr:hypothetical protein EV426DRAFT_573997 [Tirmania nivea]